MIGFRGISDAVSHAASGPTKEAQEATNLQLYERALQEQRAGCDDDARATFEELLRQPLLAGVDAEAVEQQEGSAVDSAPLLKYLCFKNMATLATKRKDWAGAVDSFAQAVSIDGTDVVVWYKMGSAAYAGEHLSVARYALEQGLGLNPKHWLTVKLLIKVLWMMGNEVASDALVEYGRTIDPTYADTRAADAQAAGRHATGEEAKEDAPEAKRQRTEKAEPQRVELAGADPSWLELVQQLVSLADKSAKQGQTAGFRSALEVVVKPAAPASSAQPQAADAPIESASASDVAAAGLAAAEQAVDLTRTAAEPAVAEQAVDLTGTDDAAAVVQSTTEGAAADRPPKVAAPGQPEANGSEPAASPRTSERKTRPSRRVGGPPDDDPTHMKPTQVSASASSRQPATKRLAEFTGTAPEDDDETCASTPSKETASTAGAIGLSFADFLKHLTAQKDRTLLSVVRTTLTKLCSDVQRVLPKELLPQLLRLHKILCAYCSAGLNRSCSVFLAEVYFSAHQQADETVAGRPQLLRQCCDLVGAANYAEPEPDTAHNSATPAALQARLSWLRGLMAEAAKDPSLAQANFHACAAWIKQQVGGKPIIVANSECNDVISASTVAQKLGALDENEHTDRISQLFSAGDHAQYVAEVAPRLQKKKKTQATPEQWCTLLKQLLVSSERTEGWDLLLQCHVFRLQYVLSAKRSPACCRILCGEPVAKASDGWEARHEMQTLLRTLRRCAKLPQPTWYTAERGGELMRLVAHVLDSLETQGGKQETGKAKQPLLAAWECVVRLWAAGNTPPELTAEQSTARCQTLISLVNETKESCCLDAHDGGSADDTAACQSLVRCLAVQLLKLLHDAHASDPDGTTLLTSMDEEAWPELWARLEALGWKKEDGKRIGTDMFFVKPGVSRGAPGSKAGRDFFNSRKKVRESLESEEGEDDMTVPKDSPDDDDDDEIDTDYDARELLDWCLLDLHGIEFPEGTGAQQLQMQQLKKKDKDASDKTSPGMEAEEAYYWYWYAEQHDFTTVLAKYGKKWKDLQEEFMKLVQRATSASIPHNEGVQRQIDAVILGTATTVGDGDDAQAGRVELTGVDKIHTKLHYDNATVKHSYMNQSFFEDNKIDQTTRRGKDWGRDWDTEQRELAVLYRRDLMINPARQDSWQSLGQCYFRMLDNLLDQHVLGNLDGSQQQEQQQHGVLSGSAAKHNERARNCFLHALALDPSSHEPLDLLGFLAFVQIRHGYRQAHIVSEAVDRFTKADEIARQNEDEPTEEWMYPFMLGKLSELQGKPPSEWMPLYWTAKARHKEMCDKADRAELVYRLHASRLKAAFRLGSSSEDLDSWNALLRSPSNAAAPICVSANDMTMADRRKKVVDDAGAKLLGLLKKSERNAWHVEGMTWFYKSTYSVAAAHLQLDEPRSAAKQLSSLFDTEKERARHFWKMHTYKLTDFGDFSFVTERHYDRWRMKCLFLYVRTLAIAGDKGSAAAKQKLETAEAALVAARNRRDGSESSSSRERWLKDVKTAHVEIVAARRDVARGQLLKLEKALKRGNDKRVLNSRWNGEARHAAMAARYIVLVANTENLEQKDDESTVTETISCLCDTVIRSAEVGTGGVEVFFAELERAETWLRDIYELFCSIHDIGSSVLPRVPLGSRNQPLLADGAGGEDGHAAADSAGSAEGGSLRCFAELDTSEHPPLENLSAKADFMEYLSQNGLHLSDFSETKVVALLRRRFARFVVGGSAVPPKAILSYCDKVFTKGETVLARDHIRASAAAAAAEAARRAEAARARLAAIAASKVAREKAEADAVALARVRAEAEARARANAEVKAGVEARARAEAEPHAVARQVATSAVERASPEARNAASLAAPAVPAVVAREPVQESGAGSAAANRITADKAQQLRAKFTSGLFFPSSDEKEALAAQFLLGPGGAQVVGKWFEKQRAKERKACDDKLVELNNALALCTGSADEAGAARLRRSVSQCQARLVALQQKPKPNSKRKGGAPTDGGGTVDFEVTVRDYLNSKRTRAELPQVQ